MSSSIYVLQALERFKALTINQPALSISGQGLRLKVFAWPSPPAYIKGAGALGRHIYVLYTEAQCLEEYAQRLKRNLFLPQVLLAVLGVCSAAPFIGDTPEVQAEKARFFQAFRAAQAAAAPQQAFQTVVPVQARWTGPVAATIPAGVGGTITPVGDTAEVAAARNAFLNAYNAQVRATVGTVPVVQTQAFSVAPVVPQQVFQHTFQQAVPVQARWTGPVAATIPAGVDGTVTPVGDTAEVAAARNAFLNAYRAQVAATVGTAPVVNTFSQAVPQQVFQQTFQQAAPVQARWTGPVAATVPAGLPGSAHQVADTAEVAAAKQAFFSAYQRQVAAAARPF
ncbi:uncharacterized protein LOC125041082 [Penaeus chinensis]|uniref:uncharacterized protein LOC125041082 n=1 Tax=Penaeus chinensis TaxID=139456 RepID=UPI001FB6F66E|nr:uncharacterized protein LOC125041082 [Penaeus chinensis]